MKRPAHLRAIVMLIVSAVLIVGAVFGTKYAIESSIRTKAAEGFEINGYWTDSAYLKRFAVLDDASSNTHTWQFITNTEKLEGTFTTAGNPNLYILLDNTGAEVGTANVAYTLAPDDGLLYLTLDSTTYALNRRASAPAFEE